MSNRALAWAWSQDLDDISAKFLLVALADQAGNKDGDPENIDSCWPSQAYLAGMIGSAAKTVERALKRLETLGLLVRERRVNRDGYRASDRYLLLLDRHVNQPVDDDDPPPPDGDKLSPPEDNRSYQTNSTQTLRTPNRDAVSGQVELRSTDPKGPQTLSSFTDFWAVYPRREDKRAAEVAFAAACRRAPVAVIIAGAAKYRDDPNREAAYTKLPSTWLRRDAWENPPLPTRLPSPQQASPPAIPSRPMRRFN